jgi:hypothetical protein
MYPYSELSLKSIFDVFRQNGYDEMEDRSLDPETPTKLLKDSMTKTSIKLKNKFLRIDDGKPN